MLSVSFIMRDVVHDGDVNHCGHFKKYAHTELHTSSHTVVLYLSEKLNPLSLTPQSATAQTENKTGQKYVFFFFNKLPACFQSAKNE
jgi:hypothetical protein